MPTSFTDQVLHYFGFLRDCHNFWGLDERCSLTSPGSRTVRLESDRYVIAFHLEGKGAEVTIECGTNGKPLVDLAWVFAYITRGMVAGPTGGTPWLYYFPYFTLGVRGDENIHWQLSRLAEILQPLWPAIFIFLDMDGPRGADFHTFVERAKRAAAERSEDDYRRSRDLLRKREALDFVSNVEKAFTFLNAYGFKRVYADPIFVRFEKQTGTSDLNSADKNQPKTAALPTAPVSASANVATQPSPSIRSGIYLNVFHRLHSFQVDLHLGKKRIDPAFELNFDLNELAGWMGATCPPVAAHSTQELQTALNKLARHFRQYAAPILAGDTRLLEALHTRRIDAPHKASRAWAERNRMRG